MPYTDNARDGNDPVTAPPDTQPIRIGDELHSLLRDPGADAFPNLADQLYERFWRRIVNLEFAPGQRLSEEALALDLGVSRTPVREALYRLSHVGLVRVTARRGFSVPMVTATDITELFDLRTAIEVFAIRRATPLLSNEEIEDLRERQVQANLGAASGSAIAAEEFVRADLRLHDLIQQRGGNRRSVLLLGDIMGQLALVTMRSAQIPESRGAAIEEHHRIVDAFQQRDPSAAAAAMEAHLQAVKSRRHGWLTSEREAQ